MKKLISQMTLEEKASLCSGLDFWYLKGVERLGVPEIMVTDGPHGLRKQVSDSDQLGITDSVPATCFPTASALAATWDRELVYQVGEALGKECRANQVSVILGPGANIKRSPLCGRNFEYFSEDPVLSGEIAQGFIRGVQSQGVGTSLKHYAVNNQEYRRMTIDAVVDERALREIYLAGYEIAVKKAQPWTLMCAYNKVNGTYCCEHQHLMRDVLKKEWGHTGLVVTDWGAMNERVPGLAAGVELEMPGVNNGNDDKIVAAVRQGLLDESVLDQAVERILNMIFKAQEALDEDFAYDHQAHHTLARRVAGEGAVLLKNEQDLLPLPKNAKIALLGQFAKTPRYQGAGSSLINPSQLDNIHDEIVKLVGDDAKVSYAPGYPLKGDQVDAALIQQAVAVAQEAEIVVICAGLTDIFEVEGVDRKHMELPPSHNALIQAVAQVHTKVVVVLSNGSPVEMPWADQVQAILEGYLGGQAGAGAIADILYGMVNPSGKLAETFPLKLKDTPAYHYFPGGPKTVEYRESIYVGYRYYDTVGCDVLFPFGHGLSYTTFEYSDLRLSQSSITDNDTLTVTLKVKNTGQVAGQEIVQLYVKDVQSTAFRPEKELKGFAKVELQPGEQTQVSIELDQRAFAYYNTALNDWHVESGTFELLVGASSRDIRLTATLEMKSSQAQAPAVDRQALAAYYDFPQGTPVSQADFENLLGRAAPGNEIIKGEPYTLNTPLEDMQDSFIGRQLLNLMSRQMQNMVKDDPDSPTAYLMQAVFKEAPLRTMLMFGGGAVSREMLDALLLMVNGKSFKGSFELVKALRAAKSTSEPGKMLTSETVVQIPLNAWVNVFLLRGEEGAVLVDTGIAGQEDLILERLAEHGVAPQDVRLILITHGHGDHVGSAAALRERTGAPIAIHALDADMLRHADQPQEFPPDSNKLLLALSRLPIMQFTGLEPLEPDITFEDEFDLAEYGVAGRVIHTPGHSPGSVTVLLDSGAAIIGDMVMGRFSKGMREPGPPIIAHDKARNRESIRQILELDPHPIYASHGGPFDDISPSLVEGGVDLRPVWVALGALLGVALLWKLLRRFRSEE